MLIHCSGSFCGRTGLREAVLPSIGYGLGGSQWTESKGCEDWRERGDLVSLPPFSLLFLHSTCTFPAFSFLHHCHYYVSLFKIKTQLFSALDWTNLLGTGSHLKPKSVDASDGVGREGKNSTATLGPSKFFIILLQHTQLPSPPIINPIPRLTVDSERTSSSGER